VGHAVLLAEFAGLHRLDEIPAKRLSAWKIEAFCRATASLLPADDSGFGKADLNLCVEEIRLAGKMVLLRRSSDTLARAMTGSHPALSTEVPNSGSSWLTGWASTQQLAGSSECARDRTGSRWALEIAVRSAWNRPV
jgi:hypothetical protein